MHALVEDDLLFVLQRLQDFTSLIEERIAERGRAGGIRLSLKRQGAFRPPRVHFRSRNAVDPLLNDFLGFDHAFALSRSVQNQRGQIFDPVSNEVALFFKGRDVFLATAQEITTVAAFQTGDVVLDQATESHHFDCVSAERILVMIAQGDQQENPDQENDNRHADRGSRQQFEMEMALTKKPAADSAEDRPSADFQVFWDGGVDRRIYHNCNEAAPLPPRLLPCRPAPAELQSKVSTRSLLS